LNKGTVPQGRGSISDQNIQKPNSG